jgi:hypothetical protein
MFQQVLPPTVDFERFSSCVEDLTVTQEVGYRGEAAVFTHLRDSHLFKTVTWVNQSSTGKRVELGDEVFFMTESGKHYDIELQTKEDRTIHVEVKSSCYDKYGGRACHWFGGEQLDIFASATDLRGSVMALIFNTRSQHPDIQYLSVGPFKPLPNN